MVLPPVAALLAPLEVATATTGQRRPPPSLLQAAPTLLLWAAVQAPPLLLQQVALVLMPRHAKRLVYLVSAAATTQVYWLRLRLAPGLESTWGCAAALPSPTAAAMQRLWCPLLRLPSLQRQRLQLLPAPCLGSTWECAAARLWLMTLAAAP